MRVINTTLNRPNIATTKNEEIHYKQNVTLKKVATYVQVMAFNHFISLFAFIAENEHT